MKKFQPAVTLWTPFALASLCTFLAYKTLWAIELYWVVLALLGALSCCLAARVLLRTGWKPLPLVGVVIGLIVGQWWLIQTLILQALWRINGFAP